MDRLIPSQPIMKKYREKGFDRHHIIEAWAHCGEDTYVLEKSLWNIHFRDQRLSEQRLVWDGKRSLVKSIFNPTRLKLTTNMYLKKYRLRTLRELQNLRKKGLLLKQEFRGHRGLNWKFVEHLRYVRLGNKDVQGIPKEMQGYVRRVRHLSIKLSFWYSQLPLRPLLKRIKHNFAGLVSLRLYLKRGTGAGEDLESFDRLFAWLRPTLKHLDLDFTSRDPTIDTDFSEALGQLIMKNLQKLETLHLNFKSIKASTGIVRYFINTAGHRLVHLKSFSLVMGDLWVDSELSLPQVSRPNQLQCLKLDLSCCHNLDHLYLSALQNDILSTCPALKKFYIRLPDHEAHSRQDVISIKKEFLQTWAPRRNGPVVFYEPEDIWDTYQDVRAIWSAKENRVEELAHELRQKGQGEEEVRLVCEILSEEDNDEFYESWDEQDYQIFDLQCDTQELEAYELEEQENAEWSLLEAQLQGVGEDEIHELSDWNEGEELYDEEENPSCEN